VRGESGTGKELVARAIHAASPRAARRFVPVDCGALPESIIESELFGHAKGAFTGATGAPGLFRVADGGTLFLDEIGELPPAGAGEAPARDPGEGDPAGRLGGFRAGGLRIIAATHRDLERMIAAGSFRTDLFYRLDVVRIEIPPLRERREDIPLLVQQFIAKHARRDSPIGGIEDDALELLCAQDWPGNVRELENVIESALALAPGPRLRASRSAARTAQARGRPPRRRAMPLSFESYERAALERALAESHGDVIAAARRLGIGRSTLYRKLARHGLRAGR
jgi:transcriptional regulator with PAS, ATPase and Fis domain